MPDTWISDEMRALVGREYGVPQVSLPIEASDIRRWAAAIYWPEAPPRLFWDESYAAGTAHGGIVAPEEFNPFAWFTSDGPNLPPSYEGTVSGAEIEEEFGVAPPQTSYVMNGGLEYEHGVRMRPGDVIRWGRTRLVEYRERETRLGLMLFTVTEMVWTNQDDERVRVTRSTGIRY